MRRKPLWPSVVVVRTPEGRDLLRDVNEAVVDIVWEWGLVADPARLRDLARDLAVLARDARDRWR